MRANTFPRTHLQSAPLTPRSILYSIALLATLLLRLRAQRLPSTQRVRIKCAFTGVTVCVCAIAANLEVVE